MKRRSIRDPLVRVNHPKQGSRRLGQKPALQPLTDRLSFFTPRHSAIPDEVVRAAYWKWMNYAAVSDADWSMLAEEVSARARSPITYPLELLKKFGQDGLEAWHEERNGRLTRRTKQAIFDACFEQSYGPY